ncbi:MAG: PDR/VanB family oxidoreductase [Acetobacter sp.]
MTSLSLRVLTAEHLSPTLRRLRVADVQGRPLPRVTPGSHIVLALPVAGGLRRNAYSITQVGEHGAFYEIIVRHATTSRGGGSAFIHTQLQVGMELAATAPSNFLALESTARKVLLIGAGVGVTPLLALASAQLDRGGAVEFHQVCTPAERDVFTALLAPFGAGRTQVHTSRAGLDLPTLFARQPLGTYIYTCGPHAMMEHIHTEATAMGWPAGRIHRENFGAGGGKPFVVHLTRSERSVAVAADQSLLDALESAGVDAPCLCRGGACGMCRTAVVDGEPEHRDDFLSAEEKASGRWIMPCVSRARSNALTLDL